MNCNEFKDHIIDYLDNAISDSELKTAMEEHYFECDGCFNELELSSAVINTIKVEGVAALTQESEADETSAKPNLLKEKIKRLIGELSGLTSKDSFSCKAYSFGVLRGGDFKDAPLGVGDPFIITIKASKGKDGYLTIFHYSGEDHLEIIFPRTSNDMTAIKAGEEKRIALKAHPPTGRHYIKAIWTSIQLIDPQKSFLENNSGTMNLAENFLRNLSRLETEQWMDSIEDFEVIENQV
jgi:hypothetical protein